jgi:2,3-bisphosphoglycerate-independent phosphoglycerate mutase
MVPIIVVTDRTDVKVKNGKLGDIAPTILSIMGVDIPEEMTGDILI